jgi:hypothetical protein
LKTLGMDRNAFLVQGYTATIPSTKKTGAN